VHELHGRNELAAEAFREVLANDNSELDWYSMWARQRLAAMRSAPAQPAPPPTESIDTRENVGESESGKVLGARPAPSDNEAHATHAADTVQEAPEFMASARKLRSLASRHDATYPFLSRAAVLAELGMNEAAGDEIYEVYRLRSEAKPARRRGGPVVRLDAATKRARLRLDGADLRLLAEAAEELGDLGLASRLGNRSATAGHPRAYEQTVRDAAARYGVSPSLLWAVMRVESRYDRRIVSYAGAVGLMQIMPRTAELIARSLGREDFRTTDLVSPRTSVEFAAWYLRSLVDRFDGSLPLALAAYNGGPHNVRRWLASHPREVPLDVFLERIPFGQTWHYVRRVMGHYARYKAGENEDVETLSVALPGSLRDPVGF
jgi:soluble lytic murein transglycosylase